MGSTLDGCVGSREGWRGAGHGCSCMLVVCVTGPRSVAEISHHFIFAVFFFCSSSLLCCPSAFQQLQRFSCPTLPLGVSATVCGSATKSGSYVIDKRFHASNASSLRPVAFCLADKCAHECLHNSHTYREGQREREGEESGLERQPRGDTLAHTHKLAYSLQSTRKNWRRVEKIKAVQLSMMESLRVSQVAAGQGRSGRGGLQLIQQCGY